MNITIPSIPIPEKYVPLIVIAVLSAIYLYGATSSSMLGEDEGLYMSYTKEIIRGNFAPTDVTGEKMYHTLLVPIVTALFSMALSNESLVVGKMVISLFAIGSFIMIWLLTRKYGVIPSILAIALMASIPLFINMSVIYYMDVPSVFFLLLSFYMISKMSKMRDALMLSAVLVMFFFTRQTAMIVAASLLVYGLFRLKAGDRAFFKMSLIAVMIFAIGISPWIFYNIATFNYPYTEGLNVFYEEGAHLPDWLAAAQTNITPNINLLNIFSPMFFIIGIVSIVYVFISRNRSFDFPLIYISVFILFAALRMMTSNVTEERYFMSLYAPMTLMIAAFLKECADRYKIAGEYIPIFIIGFILLYTTSTMIAYTGLSRYTDDYLSSLEWISDNTNRSDIIFTAYKGSLLNYADRYNKWSLIPEFPELMTTNNTTFIYDVLVRENISYILIWRGILAENYIVPESNLYGVFTVKFNESIVNDTAHFNFTYGNNEAVIFKVLK